MKVRAKKSLGQNFLQDEGVVSRIVDALELTEGERVVEIGPGLGALTAELAKRGARVTAIEFDRDMVSALRTRYAGQRVEVINEDALRYDLASLSPKGETLKLVANLPYNISTPILQRLIDHRAMFERLVLMFQKEVVDRIMAEPGSTDRGFLTVLVENAFASERLFNVPPGAFRPVPKVESSLVRLTPRSARVDDARLRELLTVGFQQKRKTIENNLRGSLEDAGSILDSLSISRKRRPETLDLEDWARLVDAIK